MVKTRREGKYTIISFDNECKKKEKNTVKYLQVLKI
ncbi:hypothetical protein SDC9_79440 [bioreactor metagenome]|uniref:Uncharacterized protein n=1 Tax=bioreactor metagenome TaxID=1076179 RepID=A0A644Z432_9ZZZZ